MKLNTSAYLYYKNQEIDGSAQLVRAGAHKARGDRQGPDSAGPAEVEEQTPGRAEPLVKAEEVLLDRLRLALQGPAQHRPSPVRQDLFSMASW